MNLRNVVLACTAAVAAVGLVMLVAGYGHGLPLFVGAAIFGLLVLGERWRYRRKGADSARGRFEPTGERYRDPSTGELMEVEYDPFTGARRYVKLRDKPVQR